MRMPVIHDPSSAIGVLILLLFTSVMLLFDIFHNLDNAADCESFPVFVGKRVARGVGALFSGAGAIVMAIALIRSVCS